MNELMNLFTSKEIIVALIVSSIAFIAFLGFYLFDKNNEKRRRKHNTRELNKLVEEIKEETEVEEEVTYREEPILHTIEEEPQNIIKEEVSTNEVVKEEPIVVNEVKEKEEELEYTTIEPDQETAKLELKKLTEELKKQQEMETEEEITVTSYEDEQEENAIISLEELINKGKEIYKNNEVTQYEDEGNEPISIQELEAQGLKNTNYEEPFIIENVVDEEEIEEVETPKQTVKLVDFATPIVEVETTFKSSPIISPVFGIEKPASNDLELENTANYEKLDEEIKRTNEFLQTLKELQSKLD